MVVLVDRSSSEAVYEQIARQIREEIASGRIPAGRALPPVRTLASDLGVNLNTVARAYRILEEEGFVRIRDRSGAEVAAPLPGADASTRERLLADLRLVLARMRQVGFTSREIREAADRAIASPGKET